MTRTVVVLGAGLAGLPLAHRLLASISLQVPDLKVILVSPNDEFYWNIASVRGVVPGALSPDKLFYSIPKLFAQYPADKFEFVAGKAETLNADSNAVVVALNDGSKRNIEYHTIIVATGSTAREGQPWKTVGPGRQTRDAMARLSEQIQAAESIVVGGAGPTGVEFAGELGSAFAQAGRKKVTLVASEALVLEPRIMASTREAAQRELEQLGVRVVTGSKITAVGPGGGATPGAQKVLELTRADGSKTTLKADLYVPTYGVSFNSDFVPASWRDGGSKRIKVDGTLRAPGYKNVFVVGDVSGLQVAQAIKAEDQVRYLLKQLVPYFKAGTLKEYKKNDGIVYGVSLGRNRGTGQMGTMKPFSLLIWWFKGRYLGVNNAPDFAAGVKGLSGAW